MKFFVPFFSMIILFISTESNSKLIKIDNFYIQDSEVTISEFLFYLKKNKKKTKAQIKGGSYRWGAGWELKKKWSYLSPFGKKASFNLPAVHITWSEARSYCQFLGGDLPTKKQWKKAAYTQILKNQSKSSNFKKGRIYPYPSGEKAEEMNLDWEKDKFIGLSPVKSFKPGINDLYDMGGNAWEWGLDKRGKERITLGASFWYGPEKTKESGFQFKDKDFHVVYIGFRCVFTSLLKNNLQKKVYKSMK